MRILPTSDWHLGRQFHAVSLDDDHEAVLAQVTGVQIQSLVAATGPSAATPRFTFSDIAQRLLPAIALDAYPDRAVEASRALQIAKAMTATLGGWMSICRSNPRNAIAGGQS